MSGAIVRATPKLMEEWLDSPEYVQRITEALMQTGDGDRAVARVKQQVTAQLIKNPELQKCSAVSVVGSVVEAALWNFQIGTTGECWMIPRKGECHFQVGYVGWKQVAYRSGQVASVDAHVVRQNDEFDYVGGSDERLRFVPADGDRGAMVRCFTIIKTVMGGTIIKVMSKEEVDHHRQKSQALDSKFSPWNEPNIGEPMMWRKTVLRQGLKMAPLSVEAQALIQKEERSEAGLAQNIQTNFTTEDIIPEDQSQESEADEKQPDPDQSKSEQLEQMLGDAEDAGHEDLPEAEKLFISEDHLQELRNEFQASVTSVCGPGDEFRDDRSRTAAALIDFVIHSLSVDAMKDIPDEAVSQVRVLAKDFFEQHPEGVK